MDLSSKISRSLSSLKVDIDRARERWACDMKNTLAETHLHARGKTVMLAPSASGRVYVRSSTRRNGEVKYELLPNEPHGPVQAPIAYQKAFTGTIVLGNDDDRNDDDGSGVREEDVLITEEETPADISKEVRLAFVRAGRAKQFQMEYDTHYFTWGMSRESCKSLKLKIFGAFVRLSAVCQSRRDCTVPGCDGYGISCSECDDGVGRDQHAEALKHSGLLRHTAFIRENCVGFDQIATWMRRDLGRCFPHLFPDDDGDLTEWPGANFYFDLCDDAAVAVLGAVTGLKCSNRDLEDVYTYATQGTDVDVDEFFDKHRRCPCQM